MTPDRLDFTPPPDTMARLKAVALAAGLILLLGLGMAPSHAWPSLLLAGHLLVGLGLGGLVFVALQHVSGAGWSVPLRRVPEAMATLLVPGAVVLAVVLLGQPGLYPWFGQPRDDPDGTLWFKHFWLSGPFFLTRAAIYLLTWVAFAAAIVGTSRRQDREGGLALTRKNVRLSAAFLVIFGITYSLASFDWLMSLEPAWYSTMFGLYNFAGLFLSGLAAIIVLIVWLRGLGVFRHAVTEQHLLDLGKLLFAFSTFWAYIWFCQYMLIWYANIPEETAYLLRRHTGFWWPFFLLHFACSWLIPFLTLLPRARKRSAGVLLTVSSVVLVGRWLDLCLMIFPSREGAEILFGPWALVAGVGALALGALLVFRTLSRAPLIPIGDPYLQEGLHYEQ